MPLWCRSNFSFLDGASHPAELIEEAHRLGLSSIALCDRDGVHGMVRAHVKARELGVKLVAGATVTVAAPERPDGERPVVLSRHGRSRRVARGAGPRSRAMPRGELRDEHLCVMVPSRWKFTTLQDARTGFSRKRDATTDLMFVNGHESGYAEAARHSCARARAPASPRPPPEARRDRVGPTLVGAGASWR